MNGIQLVMLDRYRLGDMTLRLCSLALLLISGPLYGQVSNEPGEGRAGAAAAVPHGLLHHETFPTKFIRGLPENEGRFVVYTPPNYDPARKPGYPVLYLMHGWGAGEEAWTRTGHADAMLDRMIAAGKARAMIVVMPLGYGDMTFLTHGFEVWRDEKQISENVKLFESALLKEIVPAVESRYDVAADREDRAVAGLSMGGQEALTIGLRHPELFAWVGGFSSAIFPVEGADLTHLDAKKLDLRLLWVGCGTEDDLLSLNRIFAMHLREAGVPVTVVETAGRHDWPVWREDFRRFVPLLFAAKASVSPVQGR